MRFAFIWTKAKRCLHSRFRQVQARRCVVHSQGVEIVMNRDELAIRVEKRWIVCHSLVQQIRLPATKFPSRSAKCVTQKIFLARAVKIEGNEIPRSACAQSPIFQQRDFGVKLLSDFLRNLALDSEQVFQIAIVLLAPRCACPCACRSIACSCEARRRPCRTLPSNTWETRSSSPILRIFRLPRYSITLVRLMTLRSAIFASLVKISSCTPSTKRLLSSLA